MRDITEAEFRILWAVSGDSFENWFEAHEEVYSHSYNEDNFQEVKAELERLNISEFGNTELSVQEMDRLMEINSPVRLVNGRLEHVDLQGNLVSEIQQRYTNTQRQLTEQEWRLLRRMNSTAYSQWMNAHPDVDVNSYSNQRWSEIEREMAGTPWDIRSYQPEGGEDMPRRTVRSEDVAEVTTRRRTRVPASVVVSEQPPVTYKASHTGYANMESKSDIQPVLDEYANKLKRNIRYMNAHGEVWSPEEAETLDIVFCGSPYSCRNTHVTHYFGIAVSDGQGMSKSLTDPIREIGEVLTDENDVEVMLVVKGTIYILFDLPHTKGTVTGQLMRALMDLYAASQDPKEMEMRKKVSETKAQARVGEVLNGILVGPVTRESELVTNRIADYENKVEAYRTEMLSYLQKMVKEQKRKRELETNGIDLNKKVERELKSIRKLKGVASVATRMSVLRVITEHIYIETSVGKYDIGEMSLEFHPDGVFKILNQTRKVDYSGIRRLDHPHVNSGNPCWGNMSQVMEYVYAGDIAMAVSMTIDYLKVYTQGNAFAPLDQWPLVGAVEKKEVIQVVEPVTDELVERLRSAAVAQNTVDWRTTEFMAIPNAIFTPEEQFVFENESAPEHEELEDEDGGDEIE